MLLAPWEQRRVPRNQIMCFFLMKMALLRTWCTFLVTVLYMLMEDSGQMWNELARPFLFPLIHALCVRLLFVLLLSACFHNLVHVMGGRVPF